MKVQLVFVVTDETENWTKAMKWRRKRVFFRSKKTKKEIKQTARGLFSQKVRKKLRHFYFSPKDRSINLLLMCLIMLFFREKILLKVFIFSKIVLKWLKKDLFWKFEANSPYHFASFDDIIKFRGLNLLINNCF